MVKNPLTHPLFSYVNTSRRSYSSSKSLPAILSLSSATLPPSLAILPSLPAILPPSPAILLPSPATLSYWQSSLASLLSQAPLALLPLSQILLASLLQVLLQNNWAFGPFGPLVFHLFSKPYQAQSQPISLQHQENQSCSIKLPTMAKFLKEIDKKKGTNDYYQKFLDKFEKQK
ncbi:18436_t:CDS:2, partial [Racocetra persica]